MENNHRRLIMSGMMLLGLPLYCATSAYAAHPIDLRHQNITTLQSLFSSPSAARGAASIKEISSSVDFKNTLHVRIQQTYAGYNVFGADAVVHIPNGAKSSRSMSGLAAAAAKNNGTMNGIVYQDLKADLAGASAEIFTQANAQKALQKAIENYQHQIGTQVKVSEQDSSLIVFVGSDNKARWAYKEIGRAHV